jgi:hypothetical protein
VVSDALLSIGLHADWNIVACPPDSMLLDPELATVSNASNLDAVKFMSFCEDTSDVSLDKHLLLIKPHDSLAAEAARTNRTALQSYLQSLVRTGISLVSSEAAMATSNPSFDPSLLKFYARLLAPSATPFLDTPMSALVFYGSMTADQRSWLNRGMKYNLSDLTEQQSALIPVVLRTSARHIVINPNAVSIMTDFDEPEITDIFSGRITNDAKIFMSTSTEEVLRVVGVDRWGRQQGLVLNLHEAAKVIHRLGPRDSFQYAVARSNTIRLTVHVSDSFDVVNFLREYPNGFSRLGPIDDLPSSAQLSIQSISGD